jgi:hypothetical protein
MGMSESETAPSTGRPWGHWIGGRFVVLPKIPLHLAGHLGPPPFKVRRPDGLEIEVVEMPDHEAAKKL